MSNARINRRDSASRADIAFSDFPSLNLSAALEPSSVNGPGTIGCSPRIQA